MLVTYRVVTSTVSGQSIPLWLSQMIGTPATTEIESSGADELFVSAVDSIAAQGRPTGRCHLAFQAKGRAMVEAFHKAGLAAGGTDNGAPGERPYHPGYYAAFLLDPDGNTIEAVFHGEAERSAASVVVTFES